MESLLPYLLPLLLLPLSLYLVSIVRKKGFDDRERLPPGSTGWPILGESMAYGRDGPEKFMKDRMEKWSAKVFQTSLLGERTAVFCGAEANKFLFTNESKLVTAWMPRSMRKVFMIPESDGGGYLKQETAVKRILHHAILTPETLKQYIPVMDALAGEELEREWKRSPVVKVFPLSKKYTFELSCRLFLGVVHPVSIKKLSDPFTAVVKGMLSVPIDLPGTAYSRAIKGGKMVGEELMRMIKERRKDLMEKGEGPDLLSTMVMFRDEDGQHLSDVYLANFFIGLLMASFDTTSSSITTVINYLAQLPHIYNEVFKGNIYYLHAH